MHHYSSSPIITTSHHLRGITPLSTRSKSKLFCSFAMVSWSFVMVCFWFWNGNLLLASLYRIARICKCVRSPGIDSQPGGPVRQPYLTYRVARQYRMAESVPWNQFLGFLERYKFGLRTLTNVLISFFSDMLKMQCDVPSFTYIFFGVEGGSWRCSTFLHAEKSPSCQPTIFCKNSSSLAQCFSFRNIICLCKNFLYTKETQRFYCNTWVLLHSWYSWKINSYEHLSIMFFSFFDQFRARLPTKFWKKCWYKQKNSKIKNAKWWFRIRWKNSKKIMRKKSSMKKW